VTLWHARAGTLALGDQETARQDCCARDDHQPPHPALWRISIRPPICHWCHVGLFQDTGDVTKKLAGSQFYAKKGKHKKMRFSSEKLILHRTPNGRVAPCNYEDC